LEFESQEGVLPSTPRSKNSAAARWAYKARLASVQELVPSAEPERLTAQSVNNLALLYAAQGRYVEAEPLYQRALASLEQTVGRNHPDVAKVLENYAALLAATGRTQESKEMEERARAVAERVGGAMREGNSEVSSFPSELLDSEFWILPPCPRFTTFPPPP
jgi:tetratricopeptide (TPR) repeat protein